MSSLVMVKSGKTVRLEKLIFPRVFGKTRVVGISGIFVVVQRPGRRLIGGCFTDLALPQLGQFSDKGVQGRRWTLGRIVSESAAWDLSIRRPGKSP
jgi:hypothetical protein